MIENRSQLIGLLSTTSGYSDKHPECAAEILDTLAAVGLCVIHKKHVLMLRPTIQVFE